MPDKTPAEPYIYSDVDGGTLAFHPHAQDDDGTPVVWVEADQIGSPHPVRVLIYERDANRVANELAFAAGLPSFTDRAAALCEAAMVADAYDAPAVAAELRRLAAVEDPS